MGLLKSKQITITRHIRAIEQIIDPRMTEIFTYFFEFNEGTYISQVESPSLKQSLPLWIQKLKTEKDEIKFLGNKVIEQIESQLLSETTEEITPLKGLINTWCLTVQTSKGFSLINVVKTKK